ncbi:MAG TPA: hypothetical protein VN176_15155 [Verrucomicrobiae bacterium]|jgi:hypothetical protein|nr:hypothetical protein [Verrucomicrobiae bacterium]
MFASTTGNLIDRVTQRWVQFTGRQVDLVKDAWLKGPIGDPQCIGGDYFHELARKESWQVRPGTGLVRDFAKLRGPGFEPGAVAKPVAEFYEKTAGYTMDAWSEWCSAFRPFGSLLALIFSRRLQQLNIPLSSLETSRGLTSEVMDLVDPKTGEVRITAWLRRLVDSGRVLYAGSYSTCRVPNYEGECVKVVFPLPNGNAMVIMRPVAHADGSFSVISHGKHFGDPGFYFTVHSTRGVRARYLKSLRESIRVYAAEEQTVRADHVLTLWGLTFLKLHYRLRRKPQA